MDFRKARFVKSTPTYVDQPEDTLKEVLFIGRSNVGKSSLLNALCGNHSLAFTSSKPGHTRLLNYFSLGEGVYLVDAPGYGYSAAGKKHALVFGEMMEEYFSKNDKVKLVVFLLDSRRVINEEDKELIDFIEECNIPYIIVMTKCDKLNQKETALMKKNIKEAFIDIDQSNILLSSIKNNKMLQNIRDAIIKYLH